MVPVIQLLLDILHSCWEILLAAAPWVLFGFAVAGLLQAFLPPDLVARQLGRGRFLPVVKASLFGIPLPLCSCGVIPAAVGLRRQGASKGSTAAFLVSVPETGVDSMAVTWALLDPLMTLIRPLAAFLTATTAGVLINLLPEPAAPTGKLADETPCCNDSGCTATSPAAARNYFGRLGRGLDYAFGELLEDIGKWLLLGIVIAGLFDALLPADLFTRWLDNEFLSLLVMLLAGIPLYICATASTPIAAALVLKGLSPGAALVFLLAGPATNLATITVVYRTFGRAATLVYLAAIAGCSLLLGWLTNRWYLATGNDLLDWTTGTRLDSHSGWSTAAAILLLVLLFRAWRQAANKRRAGRSLCC